MGSGGTVDPGGADWDGMGGDLSYLDAPPRPAAPPVRPSMPWYERLLTPMPWEGQVVDAMFMPDEPPPPQAPTRRGGRLRQDPLPALPDEGMGMDPFGMSAAESPRGQASQMMLRRALTRTAGDQMARGDQPLPIVRRGTTAPTAKVTQQDMVPPALAFAKALGFVADDSVPTDVYQRAFAKLTRGMSVAKLLSASQRAKTQTLFHRLLQEEAAKMPSSPMVASRPPGTPS